MQSPDMPARALHRRLGRPFSLVRRALTRVVDGPPPISVLHLERGSGSGLGSPCVRRLTRRSPHALAFPSPVVSRGRHGWRGLHVLLRPAERPTAPAWLP